MSKQNSPKHYKFVVNNKCEYFPCHKEVPAEQYNCLFCYCPFYFMSKPCPQEKEGGQATYFTTKSGRKLVDCSNCTWIHDRRNYDEIISLLKKEFK